MAGNWILVGMLALLWLGAGALHGGLEARNSEC